MQNFANTHEKLLQSGNNVSENHTIFFTLWYWRLGPYPERKHGILSEKRGSDPMCDDDSIQIWQIYKFAELDMSRITEI